jgi:hypothetical protein
MVGEGMAEAEILRAYPDLEVEDVREALRYAAEAVRDVSFRQVCATWVGVSPSRGPITHNPQPECLAYLARR